MGKIDKAMQPKHEETLSPWLRSFVKETSEVPLPLLPARLKNFPENWPFPRGDLYHWIPLLNRFDTVLERFCTIYKLNDGPQMRDIGLDLLHNQDGKGDAEDPWSVDRLKGTGFTEDGDGYLLLAILRFTRMLLKHCGNRSIYDSSVHLNDLLNTTSLDILCATLTVGSELAQRYQASVKRIGLAHRQLSGALLANHYNIDLHKVQDIASPFAKTPIIDNAHHAPTTTMSSSASKSKEKAHSPTRKNNQSIMFANDLVAVATGDNGRWNGWGDVKVTYYSRAAPQLPTASPQTQTSSPVNSERVHSTAPSTPTPLRRSTSVHQTTTQTPSPRQSRNVGSDDTSPVVSRNAAAVAPGESIGGQKTFELPQALVAQSSIYSLLSRIPADAPDTTKYEILHRIRVAKALLDSTTSRQKILATRLLAITNLAFIHTETAFVEKVLRQDVDETRRFQLVYQLAELIHPSANGNPEVPLWLQTASLEALEPIATLGARCQDVLSALNVNVNHGILLYVIRKAVAGMKQEDPGDGTRLTEVDEWRLSLFELTMSLSMSTRIGNEMASAGLMEILIEMLNMRSSISQRHHSMVLAFLDGLIWAFQNAFQSFFNTNGLDALADLFVFTTAEAQKLVTSGKGTKTVLQSQSIDYEIPYHQQQTLKWLLKFLHNVMTNAYSYGANTERLLRNLADKSDLLRSLKTIVENMTVFGSVVWTNVVTMMSDFINNDPTSFAAISESELIKTYIEVITGRPLTDEEPQRREEGNNDQEGNDDHEEEEPGNTEGLLSTVVEADNRPHPPPLDVLAQPREHVLGAAILPSADALSVIPVALNSISLNNDGQRMVVSSRVFDSFFEIFESPRHVKCMQTEHHLASNLGAHFDELARHHPSLRPSISNAVIDMVARVRFMADLKAKKYKWGASLKLNFKGTAAIADEEALRERFVVDAEVPSGGVGEHAVDEDQDVEMKDVTDSGEILQQQPAEDAKGDKISASNDTLGSEDFKPYISALTGFLSAYIANQNLKESFLQRGGIEILLDLAQSPSLPFDFCESPACRLLVRTIAILIDSTPALGLTSLLKRTQEAVDALSPLIGKKEVSFFARFLEDNPQARLEDLDKPEITSATKILRALLRAQVLLKILTECFTSSGRVNVSSFLPANVYDYFLRLVQSFGLLFPALLEEEASELTAVPTHWCLRRSQSPDKEVVRSQPVSVPLAEGEQGPDDVNNVQDVLTGMSEVPGSAASGQLKQPSKDEQSSLRYQNFNTLRVVLHPLIPSIFPLLKTVGRSLMPKRERDSYIRSRHLELAKAIASAVLEPLRESVTGGEPATKDLHYWIVLLHTILETLIDHPRPNERLPHLLIMPVLIAFKDAGGFSVLDSMLRIFTSEVCKGSVATDDANRLKLMPFALRKVLDLYSLIVSTRNVQDSTAQFGLQVRTSDRRDSHVGFYFLLELRAIIMPIIKELWSSDLVEKTPDAPHHSTLDRILEILRTIGSADGELSSTADVNSLALFQKTDNRISWAPWQTTVINLIAQGYDQDLASEAVYRTMGNATKAKEYCSAYADNLAGSRNPIPPEDAYRLPRGQEDRPAETSTATTTSSDQQAPQNVAATSQDADAMVIDANVPSATLGGIIGEALIGGLTDRSSPSTDSTVESSHATEPQNMSDEQQATSESAAAGNGVGASGATNSDAQQIIQRTKKELDDLRNEIRGSLIDRCLDVVRVHPHAALDVADLINAMIFRQANNEAAREDVGDTLANALSSLAMDEEERNLNSRSIASYAHLLALLLQQDKPFFDTCLDTLRSKVEEYLGFLTLSPSSSQDTLPPWIPYILLIIELLLAHNAKPFEFQWKQPLSEDEIVQQPVLQMVEPAVSKEQCARLLESVLEILPRIGKEEMLATSVLRVLVVLCRNRSVAKIIGEKKNLQRLFVMVKQIVSAGADRMRETKLTANVMIILRRIIEDEETTKQIMRAEIRSCFEHSVRHSRGLDTMSMLRMIPAVALWVPELFVEVANEMVCIVRWTPGGSETSRHLILQLKENMTNETSSVEVKEETQGSERPSAGDLSVTEMKQSIQDIKQSTEDKEMTDAPKAEAKRPVVENPDGVIHFLLCELLNYREVDDKDPLPPPPPPPKETKETNDGQVGSIQDDATGSNGGSQTAKDKDKKATKPQFKVEEHPIFVYRCFLLNSLAELLGSYNRTKMEFINFKRSAPPLQQCTPIKPRSSILHYLINDFLCQGNLAGVTDSVSAKKKSAISAHAQRVLVALVLKTSEKSFDKSKPKYELDEDEPDLLFVRKFVLDTVIKAYEKAPGPDETLEARYSRMQSLAELMYCMIGEKDHSNRNQSSSRNPDALVRSQTQFRRMMYEKGYLDKLTASIAEIDLSYPDVKRAIKYILRVLRSLTDTAKELSHANVISSPSPPGPGDDYIESDSSISDIDDQREETPDLYRNSTLGMLEPRNDDDDESEDDDDDEEMYDDGYAEDMEYGAEGESSQVSEEDELGDMRNIEGLHGNVVDIIVQDEDEDEDDEDEEMQSDEMDEGEDDHVEVVEDGANNHQGDNGEWESQTEDEDEDEDEEEFEENHMTPAGTNGNSGIGDDLVFAVMRESLGEPAGVRVDERYSEGDHEQEDDEEEVEEENDDEFFYDDDEVGEAAGRVMDLQELEWEVVHDLHHEPYHTHHRRIPQIDSDGNIERALARSRLVPRGPFPPNFVVDRDSMGGAGLSGFFSQQFSQRSRMNGASSNPDDGTNPLLRRSNALRDTSPRPRNGPGVISSVRVNNNVMSWADGPMSFINELMELLPLGRAPGGGVHLQITTNPTGGTHEHYYLSADTRNGAGRRDVPTTMMEPQQAVSFTLERTGDRYLEECRVVFGSTMDSCSCRLWPLVQAKLMPPAMEQHKKLKAEEEERRKQAEEEHKKHDEMMRAAREAKEAEELAAREKKEAEEREAAECVAAEAAQIAAAAAQAAPAIQSAGTSTEAGDLQGDAQGDSQGDLMDSRPMEGIETTTSSNETVTDAGTEAEIAAGIEATTNAGIGAGLNAGVAAVLLDAATEGGQQQPRVVTRLRGENLDITDLGIDPEYLAALPDEFREEVIAQAVSARRSQARQEAATGAAEPEDYQEFLDALPEDLRHEIIQQERAEQRRRERDEQRRQTTTAGGATSAAADEGPTDMDTASILLTFPPALREQVLMEQGQSLMDQLTPELASEARRLAQQHGTLPSRNQMARRTGLPPPPAANEPPTSLTTDKTARRSVVQMLDKPGVATLLRLMFIVQQGSIRQYLFSVLSDVCENRQNRLEVISTLLQILQDGSTDMEAVERSFGHLSLKAKKPKDAIKEGGEPKTPAQLRRTLTDLTTTNLGHPNAEVSPLLIVNQCLDLLVFLCSRNSQTPWLFLTEADMSSSLKRFANKKGKSKDSNKFVALNSLLALLDRDLVMESSGTMTNLADLLNKITTPLLTLERRRKEAEEEEKKSAVAAVESSQAPDAGVGETSAATEPPSTELDSLPNVAPAGGDDQANSQAAVSEQGAHDAPVAEAGSSKPEAKKEAPPKKLKIIPPPFIHASNLNLVVRIFVARECSSKTFQNTISTIKNLSTVPGTKTVFGEELVKQARILSENIVSDLSELLPHIVKAKSGTEIQGVALAKFSPGASDQNKLLRVLTALDHLFEYKKKPGQNSEDKDTSEKQDLVTSLYSNPTFAAMWEKLGACLAAIRQRENMINVATILLPLIETLMVVCKNTAIQEVPTLQPQVGKEMLPSSPSPESPIAGLFFTFTEEHRRILNELVRNNPKLMSGTFALLVKNPMVLEFDNKRNYFNRSVHSRNNGNQSRPNFQPLQLSVRRDQVFHDSFRSLFFKSGDEMKFGKLNVRFHGEEGVDAGGVTREWFQVLSRQMFYPGYALFESVPSDRTTFHPNKLSSINEEHLMFFKFIGRVIGKALYEGRVLDCYFSRAVYKRILGKSVSVKDMESFDPDYYKSLVWMLENDITDIITETFSVEEDAFGVQKINDLVPNGREVMVTEENKHEYVRLLVEHKLLSSVKEQMENFLTGFHDIIPAELIAIFTEQELELLISGLPEIDVDDWKGNTEYHGYQASSQQIQWFWRAVRSFDKEERAKLLQFVTGTSKVPLNGFKELEGMNGINRFNIHRDYGNKDRLPSSHTCFNQLDLPEYESYEFLRSQLIKAITAGSNYFGFA